MLRFFRKYSGASKVLFAVLSFSFVLWGVGGLGGRSVPPVALVEGETIARSDLDREATLLKRRYEALLHTTQLPAGLDVQGRALQQLVEAVLVRHEAARLGLGVTDAEVVAAITAMPEFQANGRFSRSLLERALQLQRDRGEFESEVRRSLLMERVESIVTDGVEVSDAEVADRYRVDHERVDLTFVRITAAELGKSVTPTDDELQRYLADHGDHYRLPVRVRVRYVTYRGADFAAQVTPSDREIGDFYDLHLTDRFTTPEQVRARHLLVRIAPGANDDARAAARKKAEELHAKAKAGEDFATLAHKHSEDPGSASKGGDLGFFPRGRMVPEFEAVAFSLSAGELSDVVESPFGFHIIKVEEHRETQVQPLDAVREEIAGALRQEHGLDLARKQAEADRRAIVQGRSLAEAAAGRPVEETPPFAKTEPIAGIGMLPSFTEAAFALRQGEVSDLVEAESAVYLLSPVERTEAYVPPLEELRERVATDLRRERGEAAARKRAEDVRGRAQEIGLEAAAREAGLAVDTTGPFERRGGPVPKLGAAGDLRDEAFALTTSAPLAGNVYTVGEDTVVVALRERLPADTSGFEAAKNQLQDSLLQEKRTAVLTIYMNFLKERAERAGKLEVRDDALGRS